MMLQGPQEKQSIWQAMRNTRRGEKRDAKLWKGINDPTITQKYTTFHNPQETG
jgi:hypothetical protein